MALLAGSPAREGIRSNTEIGKDSLVAWLLDTTTSAYAITVAIRRRELGKAELMPNAHSLVPARD
jgi:hypothetical protein